jgi:hypothetical protein
MLLMRTALARSVDIRQRDAKRVRRASRLGRCISKEPGAKMCVSCLHFTTPLQPSLRFSCIFGCRPRPRSIRHRIGVHSKCIRPKRRKENLDSCEKFLLTGIVFSTSVIFNLLRTGDPKINKAETNRRKSVADYPPTNGNRAFKV